MKRAKFDIVRDLLDHEIVDADGWPCGIVDDVDLEGGPGEPMRIVALSVGPGAAQARLPSWVAWLAERWFGRSRMRIGWHDVETIGERITLRASADALGLNAIERRWRRWIERIPGS